MRTPYGDVIPSHFSLEGPGSIGHSGQLSDTNIHLGEVQEIIYPDDDRSRTKKVVEYEVAAQISANGVGTNKVYHNCVLLNTLASKADKESWALRADPSKPAFTNKDTIGVGLGSKVLIVCIDGAVHNTVILGGINDQSDGSESKYKDFGQFYSFVFNGVKFFINDDGELLIQYNGKSKLDGTTDVDSKKTGSYIKLLKDGSITIATPNEDNLINIDSTNGNVNIKSKDKSYIKSTGLQVGDATDSFILGTTYRNGESQMNNALQGALQALQTATQALATAASAPPLTPLGTGFQSLSIAFQQMSQAIQQFEANASQYLSTKNNTD